jgi:hypothetical protein
MRNDTIDQNASTQSIFHHESLSERLFTSLPPCSFTLLERGKKIFLCCKENGKNVVMYI